MPWQTILIIRHAEKPSGEAGGFDERGVADEHSLTAQGWQRAGAWMELLAPSLPGLGMPVQTIFASRRTEIENGIGSKSRRPMQTVAPLAAKLGIPVALSFTKGEEQGLVEKLGATPGVVLVCWQHEKIPAIAAMFARQPGDPAPPKSWPDSVYNPILRFRREKQDDSAWSYDLLVPLMRAGDVPNPL